MNPRRASGLPTHAVRQHLAIRRLASVVCVLGLAAGLAACVTPVPVPRPVQSTGMTCAAPQYPAIARRMDLQARVGVRLKVALDGSVMAASITRSANDGQLTGLRQQAAQALDDEALRIGKSCRFGAVTGPYLPAMVSLPLDFRLVE